MFSKNIKIKKTRRRPVATPRGLGHLRSNPPLKLKPTGHQGVRLRITSGDDFPYQHLKAV